MSGRAILNCPRYIRAATSTNGHLRQLSDIYVNLSALAPGEDSDQPMHSHSLTEEFSLGTIWIDKDANFINADNED